MEKHDSTHIKEWKLVKGGVVWFTGLPSSRKSTLADALYKEVIKRTNLNGKLIK